MAEFAEAGAIIDEAGEGIEGEAEDGTEDGLSKEEHEELEEEVTEAKESVSKLSEAVKSIRELDVPAVLKKFSLFVIQQAAIAAIFYGANVALKKIFSSSSGTDKKQAAEKLKKTKSLSTLITDLNKISKELLQWLKDNQDTTVVIDGIQLPLPDIFTTYTKSIGSSLQEAYTVAKQLMQKDSSGKVIFKVPTIQQVSHIISSCEKFITALQGFVTFANSKVAQFPVLKSLPIGQAEVHKLRTDLEALNKIPF